VSERYRIVTGIFNRWYILHPEDDTRAWSGMRWVPTMGTVQLCNFGTEEEARQYAEEVLPVLSR
jgi:hypothetical protein